jgi:hypothetical protein
MPPLNSASELREPSVRTRIEDRDRQIVTALTRRIRVLTLHQIARTWWECSPGRYDTALGRLSLLVRRGVLQCFPLRTYPELLLEKPVWEWYPGEPPPPFGVVSYRLKSRWDEPLRVTTVYTASKQSARFFAGHGGPLCRPLQVTHDLHVSAIYLQLLLNRPQDANGWVSEDMLGPRKSGRKVPDAEIHDADGRPQKVIEFGGSYAPERVRKVHEDCETRGLPYELW